MSVGGKGPAGEAIACCLDWAARLLFIVLRASYSTAPWPRSCCICARADLLGHLLSRRLRQQRRNGHVQRLGRVPGSIAASFVRSASGGDFGQLLLGLLNRGLRHVARHGQPAFGGRRDLRRGKPPVGLDLKVDQHVRQGGRQQRRGDRHAGAGPVARHSVDRALGGKKGAIAEPGADALLRHQRRQDGIDPPQRQADRSLPNPPAAGSRLRPVPGRTAARLIQPMAASTTARQSAKPIQISQEYVSCVLRRTCILARERSRGSPARPGRRRVFPAGGRCACRWFGWKGPWG